MAAVSSTCVTFSNHHPRERSSFIAGTAEDARISLAVAPAFCCGRGITCGATSLHDLGISCFTGNVTRAPAIAEVKVKARVQDDIKRQAPLKIGKKSHWKLLADSVRADRLEAIGTKLKAIGAKFLEESLFAKTCEAEAKTTQLALPRFIRWLKWGARPLNECAKDPLYVPRVRKFLSDNLDGRFATLEKIVPLFGLSAPDKNGRTFPQISIIPLAQLPLVKSKLFTPHGGYFCADSLKEWMTIPKRIPVFKEEIDAIVRAVRKMAEIPWEYDLDGCGLRARMLKELVILMGIDERALYLQYHVAPGQLINDWDYHVALCVRLTDGTILVLDPTLNPHEAMYVANWVKKIHKNHIPTQNHLYDFAHLFRPFNSKTFYTPATLNLCENEHRWYIRELSKNCFDANSKFYAIYLELARLMKALEKTPELSKLLQIYKSSQLRIVASPEWCSLYEWACKFQPNKKNEFFDLTLEQVRSLEFTVDMLEAGFEKEVAIDALNCARVHCVAIYDKLLELTDSLKAKHIPLTQDEQEKFQSAMRSIPAMKSYVKILAKKIRQLQK